MKRLTLLILLALPLAAEDLSCFKVHDMWANDLDHYGVEWIFGVPATQAILNVPTTTTSQQQIIVDASASTSASGLLKYQFRSDSRC